MLAAALHEDMISELTGIQLLPVVVAADLMNGRKSRSFKMRASFCLVGRLGEMGG